MFESAARVRMISQHSLSLLDPRVETKIRSVQYIIGNREEKGSALIVKRAMQNVRLAGKNRDEATEANETEIRSVTRILYTRKSLF